MGTKNQPAEVGMSRKVIVARDFVGIGTIAGYCMVSRSTVRRWIKTGELRAVTLPSGRSRVPVADFVDFLTRYGMPLPEQPKPPIEAPSR